MRWEGEGLELKVQAEHECDAKDFATAVGTFDQALELWPDNAEIQAERDAAAHKARAAVLQKHGQAEAASEDFDAALISFTAALTEDPGNDEIAVEKIRPFN